MREPDNIREVARLGIDMMGFIFYPKSPRYVTCPVDRTEADEHLLRVGVFVNENLTNIMRRVGEYDLDVIQLHGGETRADCLSLRKALDEAYPDAHKIIIKAISVSGMEDVQRYQTYEGVVDLLLFDTQCKTVGGSGEQFDWQVLDSYEGDMPFLLSGGIGPADVARLLTFHHPRCAGFDLNSRFELSPALKDVKSLEAFLTRFKQR